MGIPEDPATGSAQCALAPYWAARLGKKAGLIGWQASVRGGRMELAVQDSCEDAQTSPATASVLIKGSTQVVIRGTIALASL